MAVLKVYTKINTLYKRYAFDAKECPNKKWLKMRNKIILGDFSDETAKYLYDCLWEAYSKIDGTNSKIAFYPSTQEIVVGGKTPSANSMHGQFEMLQEIGERIKPMLCEMFPKESARFEPLKENNKVLMFDENGDIMTIGEKGRYSVTMNFIETPIYIYGEYCGEGIQKCGTRYIKDGNDFVVFDICQQGWWLPKERRDEMCKALGLKQVPYLGVMTLREIEEMVKNGFATKFDGASDLAMIEEGIVARPIVPIFGDSRGSRIIVKVKYCDYAEYDAARKEFTDEEFKEFEDWYQDHKLM